MKRYFILILIILCMIIQPTFAQNSLLQEEFSNPDFSTPEFVNAHVINFFHHSCGGNLLNNSLANALQNLGFRLHSGIYTQYEYENVYTDYRHWYKRFQRELGIRIDDQFYRFEGPDQFSNPLIGEMINDNYQDFMLNYYELNAEIMDIIMFKPCYPNSAITNYDTQYDNTETNNGYGVVIGGTPHSDNNVNNFTYLNSSSTVDSPYGDSVWRHGQWDGTESSLAQLKTAYRGMLSIFANHPNILFIAMQAPPMVYLSDDQARNCREFARWMREDWLHQYDPAGTDQFQDYPFENVVPFDFHNAVAWTGEEPELDNEYFWFPQKGHPDNTLDHTNPSKIGRNAGDEDHPETWLNERTTTLFCGGIDNASAQHLNKSPGTYMPWINAVVNRWEKSQNPTAVKLTNFSANYDESNDCVKLYWSFGFTNLYERFHVQRRSADQPGWKNLASIKTGDCARCLLLYSHIDTTINSNAYYYRLELVRVDGSRSFSKEIQVNIIAPRSFLLNQNYPNPFNLETTIPYWLSKPSSVKITLYDLLGREIRNIVPGQQSAGYHEIIWDGMDQNGKSVHSGIYLYQLSTKNLGSMVKKLTVLK